jgi:hypothetical protein
MHCHETWSEILMSDVDIRRIRGEEAKQILVRENLRSILQDRFFHEATYQFFYPDRRVANVVDNNSIFAWHFFSFFLMS